MKFLQNLTVKQRQRLLLLGVGAVFILLVVGGSYLTEKKKEERIEERKRATKKMSLLTDKVEKDLWIAAEGQNIKALEKSNEELRHRLDQLSKELDDTKRELKKKAEAPSKMPPIPPPAPTTQGQTSGEKKRSGFQVSQEPTELPPPEEVSFQPDKLPFSPARPPKGGQDRERIRVDRDKADRERKVEPYSSIRIFKEEGRDKKEPETKRQPARESRSHKKPEEEVFLPAGSFMKAVTISGIDAPTSGGSQSEPYPVLLGITDLSVLPNRFKMNLRECFIIGAGYGNLSDERAYIRTETLSCVRDNGTVVDVPLKGHVIGEDGKLGMRGRLVSKQGQKIAMAIVTGTLASFGSAFKPQTASVLQLDPKQSGVFRYEIEDVLQAGALGGVGNALNKVADYYLRLAEKIFPIIEIDAGREVEILVLKGQELRLGGGKG